MAGARVEVAPYKRAPGDFVLWKPSPPELVGWESPWGRGRPGWHIECSAMAGTHLGETIDIHGGGLDLVFPHHENEIAQSSCAHAGAPIAAHWMHNGMVNMNSEKMAKSLGNVVLIKDLVAEHPGEVIRAALLSCALSPAARLERSSNRGDAATAGPPLSDAAGSRYRIRSVDESERITIG